MKEYAVSWVNSITATSSTLKHASGIAREGGLRRQWRSFFAKVFAEWGSA